MTKKLNYLIYILSFIYFALNFNKIVSTFKSDLWSTELDLFNHVTNYNFQLHVISWIMIFIVGNLAVSHWLGVEISKWILIPIAIIITVLLLNTQIDLIRWIEINVFGGGALLLFTVLFLMNFGYGIFKRNKTVRKNQ